MMRRCDGVVAPSLLHLDNDYVSQIASETPEFDLGMSDWHENGENIPGRANILEPAAPREKRRRLSSERSKDVVSLDELRKDLFLKTQRKILNGLYLPLTRGLSVALPILKFLLNRCTVLKCCAQY